MNGINAGPMDVPGFRRGERLREMVDAMNAETTFDAKIAAAKRTALDHPHISPGAIDPMEERTIVQHLQLEPSRQVVLPNEVWTAPEGYSTSDHIEMSFGVIDLAMYRAPRYAEARREAARAAAMSDTYSPGNVDTLEAAHIESLLKVYDREDWWRRLNARIDEISPAAREWVSALARGERPAAVFGAAGTGAFEQAVSTALRDSATPGRVTSSEWAMVEAALPRQLIFGGYRIDLSFDERALYGALRKMGVVPEFSNQVVEIAEP